MVPEGPNDLFVVGDAHQRIYRRGQVVLARCGIRIVGRARKLRLNYRTTEETRRWATRLLHGRRVDDLNGGSDGHRVRSLTRGPEPVVKRFGSAEDEAKGVVRYLGALPPKELRSVCVVARTKKLRNAVRDAVRRAGCPVFRLSGATVDDETRDGVRFATMHRVKGLEFDRVVVVGVNRGMVPHLGAMNAAGDPVERRAAETAERSLLHVAATRAKKELLITSFGRPSPFLS